jgi:F0F1-type ATP synthase membrane subunit b/b'
MSEALALIEKRIADHYAKAERAQKRADDLLDAAEAAAAEVKVYRDCIEDLLQDRELLLQEHSGEAAA